MPSTYSVSNCSDLDSSTVMTPSLPTLSITSAISWPISGSAAELVATEAISSLVSIFCAILRRAATTTSVASSMPRLISIGLEPAARLFRPSVTIACASTVEVVVPSPAMSLVLVAASFSSWAPMFSYGSSSSISLATVTPSWVMVGAPYFLSMATLRPLGPSVVPTALARISTPFFKRRRASSEKTICLAVIIRCSLFRELSALLQADRPVVLDDRQQVAFFQDQQLLAIVLELRAGVLGEQDRFAHGHIQRHAQSLIVARAWASGPDRALLRLFLGRLRQHQAARGHVFLLKRFHYHTVPQGLKIDCHVLDLLSNTAFHLELHQAVQLHRILHRQLLHQWLDKAAHDQAG